MYGEEKLKRFLEKHPHRHWIPSQKPHLTRRHFFQVAGAGLTGSFLATHARADDSAPQVTLQNKAKNVVFILLTGAPSHTDTFDLKEGPWTPASFKPTS